MEEQKSETDDKFSNPVTTVSSSSSSYGGSRRYSHTTCSCFRKKIILTRKRLKTEIKNKMKAEKVNRKKKQIIACYYKIR